MVNLSRIDLNLFVVFDAIYTERGITRAGERLNLTQPAISHALSRLRDLIGDPLFVREGHAMAPTPVARGLIEPVRRAIREIESSLNGLQHFDPATSTRSFTIGIRHVLESAIVPALVARLRVVAPQVVIASAHHDRQTMAASLANGELDAVVDVPLPAAPQVLSRHLGSSALVVALRSGHPLENGPLGIDQYLALAHVQVTSRRLGVGLEDAVLQRAGLNRTVAVRCQHHWTAAQVVASTDLALTLPAQWATAAHVTLGNRLRPFPIDTGGHDVHLHWHARADDDAGNTWLRQQLADAVDWGLPR